MNPYEVCEPNVEPHQLTFSTNIDCIVSTLCNCTNSVDLTKNLFEITPFLYAFSIEFSILVGKFFRFVL